MTVTRLRSEYTPEELANLYPRPHNHTLYGRGHDLRVRVMVKIARDLAKHIELTRVADLSAGNAMVAFAVGAPLTYLGDIAPGYEYQGPIEETIHLIPSVDLFISGETLEHVDDPPAMLAAIRDKTSWLLLSTPTENWDDSNREHLWAWSERDVTGMLTEAGFDVKHDACETVDSRQWGEPYRYGIWLCR